MEPPSSNSILISNRSAFRTPRKAIRNAGLEVLAWAGRQNTKISIELCSAEAICDLNRTYRGIDAATDVLTFPSGMENQPDWPLGDIAICAEVASAQAKLRRVSFARECAFLTIHGALHLLGYDDESPVELNRMMAATREVLRRMNIELEEDWFSIYRQEEVSLEQR
jgi:probable rRNA maturation factor